MRDYAKVAPQFWTGKTGKALKASGPEAVIVGMYLMTSPHANMIGVYHCPLAYIAFDTGLGIEGATKGLQSAIEADFCTFEADTDYVFVHEFAAYQIGEDIDPKDNRVKGIKNELDKVPKGQCWQAFRARYAVPFHLPSAAPETSPLQAPLKPGAEAGAEEEKPKTSEANASGGKPPAAEPQSQEAPSDPRRELYEAGKSLLAAQGMPKAQTGSFITKLAQDCGQDAALEAVRSAVSNRPLEAAAYLKATCQRLKGERKDPVTVASDAAEKTAAMLRERAAVVPTKPPAAILELAGRVGRIA